MSQNKIVELFQLFLNILFNTFNKETHLIENTSYYSKLNEIGSVETFNHYTYPLNKGNCWNCGRGEYSHSCCVACKQEFSFCDCVYICGATYPTQTNKRGEYCQFKKCRYYTNDKDKISHRCKGHIQNNQINLFIDEHQTKKFNLDAISRKYCNRCNSHDHFSSDCSQTYIYYLD